MNSLKSDLSSLKEEVASGKIHRVELTRSSTVTGKSNFYTMNGKITYAYVFQYIGDAAGCSILDDIISVIHQNSYTGINEYFLMGAYIYNTNGHTKVCANVCTSEDIGKMSNVLPETLYATVLSSY